MKTPHDEGWSAGYVGDDRLNPYRKGMAPLPPEVAVLASEWDRGRAEGDAQARDDLYDKRREACR